MPHIEIKSKIGAEDICRARGYEINRAGFIACGSEKTPSLKIYDDGGWRCYKCDEGGDCFDLLRHTDGMTPKEALSYCADLAGVDLCRSEVIITKKVDYKALREAYDGTATTLCYRLDQFRFAYYHELFCAICCGFCLDHTEKLRKHMCSTGQGWRMEDNVHINKAIDWLFHKEEVEAFYRKGWMV